MCSSYSDKMSKIKITVRKNECIDKEVKYVDLCCGIGGFRVAINHFQQINKQYAFRCVYSADIKDDAIKTYNLNFGENMGKRDLYDIESLPKFDLLCAGFPCQPFSSAGNKKGFSDERGGIIFKILDICKKHHPETLILENVSNLLSIEGGTVMTKIVEIFEEIGYNISYKKLNSVNFGVPQSRERVYIVGCLGKNVDMDNIRTQEKKRLRDIIDIECQYTDITRSIADKLLRLHKTRKLYGFRLQDKRGGLKNIHSWDIEYNGALTQDEIHLMNQMMTERRKKHWADSKNITWMDGMPLTFDEIRTFNDNVNLQSMLNKLVEYKYLKFEKCKDLVNGVRKYKEDSEEGYNICKGKLSFPISTILDPDGISPTLTATDCSKLVFIIKDNYIRKLTDNEIKKICGFPENFQIPEDVDKYDLFGNMVVPPVIVGILGVIFT